MIHLGDCLEVMAGMDPESVDAIVTDPPYGLEFMGKAWDAPWRTGTGTGEHNAGFRTKRYKDGSTAELPISLGGTNATCRNCGGTEHGNDRKSRRRCRCDKPEFPNTQLPRQMAFQAWSQQWAEAAYRVAKPSAYLLAFGGTRTVHRMTVALEDAGWIIRDMLVWGYASGFPKSKASLKPAWEPIIMARKPGPLRMLAIDECRIGTDRMGGYEVSAGGMYAPSTQRESGYRPKDVRVDAPFMAKEASGRWPANIVLTDPIFDGGVEGVVGGGWQSGGGNPARRLTEDRLAYGAFAQGQETGLEPVDTEGTYSRFFLIPKADRADREPVLGGQVPEGRVGGRNRADGRQWDIPGSTLANNKPNRENVHPTVKPTDLMRHLVRLVTPTGGIVLDPFLGSGTTGIAAEMEGFAWIGIEREAEYVAIAEARLNGTQRGLGLDVPAPVANRKLGPDKGGGTRCSWFPGPCQGHPGHGKYGPTVHVETA